MAASLYGFYAPLTIAGTLIPIVQSGVSLFTTGGSAFWLLSGLCAIGLLLFYFLFFKAANESFATEKDQDRAAATLAKWASLHTARTLVAIAGFVFAIAGLGASQSN